MWLQINIVLVKVIRWLCAPKCSCTNAYQVEENNQEYIRALTSGVKGAASNPRSVAFWFGSWFNLSAYPYHDGHGWLFRRLHCRLHETTSYWISIWKLLGCLAQSQAPSWIEAYNLQHGLAQPHWHSSLDEIDCMNLQSVLISRFLSASNYNCTSEAE